MIIARNTVQQSRLTSRHRSIPVATPEEISIIVRSRGSHVLCFNSSVFTRQTWLNCFSAVKTRLMELGSMDGAWGRSHAGEGTDGFIARSSVIRVDFLWEKRFSIGITKTYRSKRLYHSLFSSWSIRDAARMLIPMVNLYGSHTK